MSELLHTALKYHEHGLQVMPLPSGSKRPAAKWQQYTARPNTEEQIIEHFTRDNNIAILGGEISNNFFVLDFDSMAAFNAHRRGLERVLSNTAVVKTARGIHVYLRAPYAVGCSRVKGLPLDIKGEGGYVVAPPSLHPDGKQYTFWDTFAGVLEIDPQALPYGIRPAHAAQEAPDSVLNERVTLLHPDVKPYGLSGHSWQILKADPAAVGKYASRSEAEMSVVTYCVRCGWTFEQISGLFHMHTVPGTKFRDQKAGDAHTAETWLRSLYTSAREYLAENQRYIDSLITQYQGAARFQGRTALTDAAVYSAIISIARRCGKLEGLGLSIREIAELSGVHYVTAHKSLKRIPYLKPLENAVDNTAKTYLLTNPADTIQTRGVSKSNNPLQSLRYTAVKDCMSNDTWTFQGLGKTGFLVYSTLDDTGKTPAAIIKDTGILRRTVFRKLDRLVQLGAVRKEGALYFRVPDFDIEHAAVALGTAGTGERRKAQHRKERAAYNAYLQARDKKN